MKSVQHWNLETILQDQDLWSKLTDGVLASAILFLIWLIAALADRPIQVVFGTPGLLVYALGLLAVAMFSFQQSLVTRRIDSSRAWYGIAGGLLVWSMIEVSVDLGLPMMPGPAGIIMLIMVSLVVWLLWHNYLPIGARFFALTLLLNWAELIFLSAREFLSRFSPVFITVYQLAGYAAILGIILVGGWIMVYTRKPMQRISGALVICFLGSLAIYLLWGSLF